jgi:AcrR family transcriptional regulator
VNLRLDPPRGTVPGRDGDHGRFYAGQSSEERDAARRSRLHAAMYQVAGTRGYHALAVDRVCTAANVSTRHFYEMYDGKEAAFADLYDELLKQAGARALASLEATDGRPIAERIPDALMAFLESMFRDPRSARICFVEVVGLSAKIEATRMRNRELLIELIEQAGAAAVANGEIEGRDFRFAAIALISATTALVHDWMSRDPRQPAEWLARKLTQLAIHLLTS